MRPRVGNKEDRVFKPYPLSEVTIVGQGMTVVSWLQQSFSSPKPRVPGHEVWVLNGAANVLRHDVLFNMHDLEALAEAEPEKDYLGVYAGHDKPVVTIRALEGVDSLWEYPFAEVIEAFGETYFANGIPYLIAFALLCGVKVINIFGCDYDYEGVSEYEKGRCNLEYWLGFARAKGVMINIPAQSSLCDMKWRMTGKGRIGYGGVYGFFERQPVIQPNAEGKPEVLGFSTPPAKFDDVEAAVNTDPKERAIQ